MRGWIQLQFLKQLWKIGNTSKRESSKHDTARSLTAETCPEGQTNDQWRTENAWCPKTNRCSGKFLGWGFRMFWTCRLQKSDLEVWLDSFDESQVHKSREGDWLAIRWGIKAHSFWWSLSVSNLKSSLIAGKSDIPCPRPGLIPNREYTGGFRFIRMCINRNHGKFILLEIKLVSLMY